MLTPFGWLAMVACAHLCGAPLGHRDLKAFARRFTQAQRRALGVKRDPKTGHYPSPSKATFCRVLQAVDPLCVEAALLEWQKQVRGPAPKEELLAAAAWVLGIFRRIAVSLFMHWRSLDPKRAKSTLTDFHEEMGLEHQRRAFAMVDSKSSRALNPS